MMPNLERNKQFVTVKILKVMDLLVITLTTTGRLYSFQLREMHHLILSIVVSDSSVTFIFIK